VTTWYVPSKSNCQVLLVDETTLIDYELLRGFAAFLGVDTVYLVGDASQSGQRAEAGEGVHPLSPHCPWNILSLPTHELIWNFRLDSWRVKLLNHLYGYRMKTRRTDVLPPLFLTQDQYKELKPKLKPDFEMVFAHEAARTVFGTESTRTKGPDLFNLSVKTKQGLTVVNTACSASAFDERPAADPGLRCVALSRAKQVCCFVGATSERDGLLVELEKDFYCDTQERKDFIKNLPWPIIPVEPDHCVLTQEEVRVGRILEAKIVQGAMVVQDGHPMVQQTVTPEYKKVLEAGVTIKLDKDIIARGIYAPCALDIVKSQRPDLYDQALDVVLKWYTTGLSDGWSTTEASGKKLRLIPFLLLFKKLKVPHIVRDMRGFTICSFNCWTHEKNKIIKAQIAAGAHLVPLIERELPCEGPGYLPGATVPEFSVIDGTFMYVRAGKSGKVKFKHSEHLGVVQQALLDLAQEGPVDGSTRATLLELDDGLSLTAEDRDVLKLNDFIEEDPANWGGMVGAPPLKATFSRVDPIVFERNEDNHLAYDNEPISSSWKMDIPDDPLDTEPVGHQKLRLGTDGFRLARFVDKTDAFSFPMLNVFGPVKGPVIQTNAKYSVEGFLFDRTKGGKIKRFAPKQYRAFTTGVGNHFNNTPVETALAATRLGRLKRKPKLNSETKAWARKVAEESVREHWLPQYNRDRERTNAIVERAVKDAHARNYHGRGRAEYGKSFTPRLTVSNKDQFKPLKSGKLDLFKPGQALLQSPALFNLKFIGWHRGVGSRMKETAKSDVFFDDYEDSKVFRKRVTLAIDALPSAVRIGIADAKEFDSQQNPVTCEIEKQIARLVGEHLGICEEFYLIRGNLPFFMYGIFRGTTDGEKGSGFLDTKAGNTKLQGALSNYVYKGDGPKVVCEKGDDYMRAQTNLRIDELRRKEVKVFAGMELEMEIGDGGEFCGNTVSRAGMFPSIVRATRKALAAKSRDYKQFTEQQIAYRDKLAEYSACGVEETVAFSARAEGVTNAFVEIHLAILNSLAHINKSQWLSRTTLRKNPLFHLNTVGGPTLI